MSDGERPSPSGTPRPSDAKHSRSDVGPTISDSNGDMDIMSDEQVGAMAAVAQASDRQYVDQKFEVLHRMLLGVTSLIPAKSVLDPAPPASTSGFSGFHDMSQSEEDNGAAVDDADPLDGLDAITSAQPCSASDVTDVGFQKYLDDLSGFFHGDEEKCDPLAEKLASIFNASLRRRPNDDSVKTAAARIKLPANVPHLKVPTTNSDVTKAMNSGGKLLDARLTRTNGLVSRAMVPLAQILSDFGEKNGKPVEDYLGGLNDSLRLLAAAFNYLNQLRKEVARISVSDSALAGLCKWDYDVGKDELFPFDVTKKCDELHKSKTLGRYKRYPPGRSTKFTQHYYRHDTRGASSRPKQPYKPAGASKPFLGYKPARGRGYQNKSW